MKADVVMATTDATRGKENRAMAGFWKDAFGWRKREDKIGKRIWLRTFRIGKEIKLKPKTPQASKIF